MTDPNAPSWRPDPEGRYDYRWWDGQQWTEHVSHQGQMLQAPLGGGGPQPPQTGDQTPDSGAAQPQGGAHAQAAGGPPFTHAGEAAQEQTGAPQQPQAGEPAPGHHAHGAQPAFGGQYPPHQQAVAVAAPGAGHGFAGITGDLIDGRFSEKEARAIGNQNSKMLRVRLGEPFLARQGSMVAYQGNVDFSFEGGGASRFIKKALTGEGLPLMRVAGQGDVFLADRAYDVHLLHLTNSALSVSGKNVLAFASSLDWNIERVKGGSIAAGGLFNTTLRGTGWVALTTDGPPVVLNAAEAPTFADTNAVVAWSANLQTQLKMSFKAGALIGRGSGEAIQVSFYGQGFVIVQPSEGYPQAAAT
nr:MAG: tellurium resistance protein [Mycolicibacterium hassiacum]